MRKRKESYQPIVVGVAGGTGSGKTTVVEILSRHLGRENTVVLPQDRYYRDRSALSREGRSRLNYDHPDALEMSLLASHIRELAGGRLVQAPCYDFSTHTRTLEQCRLAPARVILVEGTLIYSEPEVRELISFRIFVAARPALRLARRLCRDVVERGRTVETVVQQYLDTVEPMHQRFVEPSKCFAHLILPWDETNQTGVRILAEAFRSRWTNSPA